MNKSELQGRTSLVTGGSRGIGRACSLQLATAGAKVAVVTAKDKLRKQLQKATAADLGAELQKLRDDGIIALKELPLEVGQKEYDVLRELEARGAPAVKATRATNHSA